MLSRMISISAVLFCIAFMTVNAGAAFTVDGQTVGLWHMDEGSGTMVFDATANAYDFSPVGSGIGLDYVWSSGYEMGGLSVPAIVNGSYLQSTIALDKFAYQVTAEAWIKPTSADSDGSQIISLYNGFNLCTVDGGANIKMVVYANYQWLTAVTSATSPVNLYDGNWHHVAGVFDGRLDANGRVHVYLFIDGKMAAHASFAETISTYVGLSDGTTGPGLYIGANCWAPSIPQHFVGDIDEARISNIARYIPDDPTVIGLWHMDETSGTNIIDSSGFGANLTKGTSYSQISPGYNGTGYALATPLHTSDDYCYGTLVSGSKPVDRFTIDTWIKPTDIDIDPQSVIAGVDGTFDLFLYGTPSDCILKLFVATNKDFGGAYGTYPNIVMSGASRLFDGNWHHVCGVFDGVPDINNKVYLRLYVDDVLAVELALDSAVSVGFEGGSGQFYIGVNPWLTGITTQNYIGAIDEVKLLTVAKKYGCGSLGYLDGDVNKDCTVDLVDFAAMAANWLKCNNPSDTNCNM